MLNLTDMWKADGSDPSRQPTEWIRSSDAQRFAEFVMITHNLEISQVLISKRGKGGGTIAHWQLGFAYASYLSPEFRHWCNTVVRERMERFRNSETVAPPAGALPIIAGDRPIIGKRFPQTSNPQA